MTICDDVSDALYSHKLHISKFFRILVENAIKFSTYGEVNINISEEPMGLSASRFHCSVIDNGIGISAASQNSIFEPFVQVYSSNSRRYEGIGLGLAIAKRMVEQMKRSWAVDDFRWYLRQLSLG